MGMSLAEYRSLTPEEKEAYQATVDERREKVWGLKVEGKSFSEIGRLMGMSPSFVKYDCEQWSRRAQEETLSDLMHQRALELERVERLIAANFTKAENGDIEAFKVVQAMMIRKSKMLGLDAPTKFQHQVSHVRPRREVTQAELDEKLRVLYTRLRSRGKEINPQLEAWYEEKYGVAPESDSGRTPVVEGVVLPKVDEP